MAKNVKVIELETGNYWWCWWWWIVKLCHCPA